MTLKLRINSQRIYQVPSKKRSFSIKLDVLHEVTQLLTHSLSLSFCHVFYFYTFYVFFCYIEDFLSISCLPVIIFFSYGILGFPISYFLGFHTSLAIVGIWIGLLSGLFFSSLFLFLRLSLSSMISFLGFIS